jgi:3-oxoacyl-[acyl-carrier-protein] synthase II
MKRRVVVTGLGVVSSLGSNADALFESLCQGKSGIRPITHFSTEGLPTHFAGAITDFDPGDYIDKKQARRIDRAIAFAIVAGKKSVENAGLDLNLLNKRRAGVIVGSGMGGMSVFAEGVNTANQKGLDRVSPFFVPYILTNMCGALLGMELGFQGPNYSISTACATGNNSIIAAAEHIRKGDADLMITGGTEAAVIPMGMAGFCACKALSQRNEDPVRASRPWDKDRDGFVMGEGAGVIVLESLEHALKRGAPILAEYLGGGLSCDAYHMTEPHPEGLGVIECVKMALESAGVTPDEVDYINAHATSTPVGDMAEVRALQKIFLQPQKISMNATKSMIGHALGAAGGIEAVVTVKSILEGRIHPTINLENPEPDLFFDVPLKEKRKEIRVALSNSFGFGGHNATCVFGKFRG